MSSNRLPVTAYRLPRQVEREWLDELPAEDPRAIRCRRDLRLMNRIMGNARVVEAALRRHVNAEPPRVVELGAGDGTLMLRVARKLGWREAEITFVDQQPVVSEDTIGAFEKLGWRVSVVRTDLFAWIPALCRNDDYDAIIANLFLHHFETERLRALFRRAAEHTRVFVAAEPERAVLPLAGSYLVGLLGCNDVTRHDAVLSVRAGFRDEDLSRLWPPGWKTEEGRRGLFTHGFVAVRP